MRNKKFAILAGAVLTAMPVVASAAPLVTFTFNSSDVLFSTSANGTFTSSLAGCSYTAGTNTVTLPAGDFFEIGMQGAVSGNSSLGLAAYQVGFTPSSTNVQMYNNGTNLTTATIEDSSNSSAPFANANDQQSAINGSGATGSGNNNLGTAITLTATSTLTQASYAASSAAELFNKLEFSTSATAGNYTVATSVNGGLNQVAVTRSGGGYKNSSTGVTASYPTLNVDTTSALSTHPIISLTSSAPSGYGTSQGALDVTGSNGSYIASTVAVSPSTGLGYVTESGAFSANDSQTYGLDISDTTTPANLATELGILQNNINTGGLATAGASADRKSVV